MNSGTLRSQEPEEVLAAVEGGVRKVKGPKEGPLCVWVGGVTGGLWSRKGTPGRGSQVVPAVPVHARFLFTRAS